MKRAVRHVLEFGGQAANFAFAVLPNSLAKVGTGVVCLRASLAERLYCGRRWTYAGVGVWERVFFFGGGTVMTG